MRHWRMAAIATLAVCCLGSAARAETDNRPEPRLGHGILLRDVITPPEWGGIWSTESELFDCETNQLLDTQAYTDTICAGENIEFGDPEFPFTCTGSANANTVHVECSGSFEIIEDCVMNFSTVFDATRNGDTIEAVTTQTTTYVGAGCLFLPDECVRMEATSTRIGPEPVPCGSTPVEAVDWGTVKSLYR